MKLHNIQYMRALAALLVVYVHSQHQVGAYAEHLVVFGDIGVDLFFIISGFIMVWVTKDSDTPISFMKRRITRIVPLYWSATLLMGISVFLFPEMFKTAIFSAEHLVKSLLFIPHLNPGRMDEVWPILVPGWTLNYEMYFYLIFSLALFAPKKVRLYVIVGSISFLYLFATAWHESDEAIVRFLGNSLVFEFAAGAIVATGFRSGLQIGRGGIALLLVGSALSYFLLAGLPRGVSNGLPALLFFVGLLYLRIPQIQLASKLGDASYSIYLSHLFVLGTCREIIPPLLGNGLGAALWFVAISVFLSILIGLLVYSYIEKGLHKRLPQLPLFLIYKLSRNFKSAQ